MSLPLIPMLQTERALEPKSTGDAVGDGVVRGMEKSDLIKKCMRVRGYSG